VRIDYTICNSCGLCREVFLCPEWAITQKYLEPRHLYEVHPGTLHGLRASAWSTAQRLAR